MRINISFNLEKVEQKEDEENRNTEKDRKNWTGRIIFKDTNGSPFTGMKIQILKSDVCYKLPSISQ